MPTPFRPKLKNQIPKKVFRKTPQKQDESFNLFQSLSEVLHEFGKLKRSVSTKIESFTNDINGFKDKIKKETEDDLKSVKDKFIREKDILSQQTQTTQKETRVKINNEIGKVRENLIDQTNGFADSFLNNFQNTSVQEFKDKTAELQKVFDNVKLITKGERGDRGDKGDLPIPGKDYFLPKNGKDATLTLEKFIQLVRSLPHGSKLKISDIDTLEERLTEMSSRANGGGNLGGGQGSWKQKALLGTIDGANTTFTFSGVECSEFAERVFLNYIEQNPFTDYTINYKTNTVEYTVAPHASLSAFPHIIRYM